MKRIGIEPGQSFDIEALDPATREALEQALAAAREAMQEKLPTLARVVNGWQMNTDTVGVYGNYYLKRALLTILGMGAIPPEEGIYPIVFTDADGTQLDGENDYVLTSTSRNCHQSTPSGRSRCTTRKASRLQRAQPLRPRRPRPTEIQRRRLA